MSFQLSKTIDGEKIFFVKRNKLEGRFDPHFYKPEYQRNVEKIGNKKSIKLNALVQFSSETWDQKSYFGDSFPYIEIGEIDLLTGEIKIIQEVPVKEAASRARMIVRNNDIIISTTRPQRGAISFVNNSEGLLIASTGFAVIRGLRSCEIQKEFLFHLLRFTFSLRQLEQRSSGGNYPAITIEELKKILLPIPAMDTQTKVIEKIHAVYRLKKQKEAQAKELLDGMDIKLLQELGVCCQEGKSRSIKERIFFCDSRSVSGRRLDPLFHSGQIYGFIEEASCEFLPLSKLEKYMKSGFASGRQEQSRNQDDVIQIRPTNINMDRELVFDRNVYISKDILDDRKDDVLQKNEILFNNTNSQEQVGKSVLFDLGGQYFCSNHITRIATNAQFLDPQYLTDILNLYQRFQVFYKLCTNWNNQSGVGLDVLGTVKIPVPKKVEKQREISADLKDIRSKAKQLRQEAIAEVERAKAEVEKMILRE